MTRRLGEGGIDVVHAAIDRSLGRKIALKSLRAGRGSSTHAELRFIAEARLTGKLEHPGIMPVYELGERDAGGLYYTMPLVRGETFADALAAAGDRLDVRLRLLPRLHDTCQAIAYAHSQGVIHRDLKPANVMLATFGRTLVLDWGLAKPVGRPNTVDDSGPYADGASTIRSGPLDASSHDAGVRTADGAIVGTPAYMAPEQARGERDAIDLRSDVWALGAMLYELLTGRPPFRARSAVALVHKVANETPKPVLERIPRAPRELAAIADRALQRDPDTRYPDAGAMLRDLEAYQAGDRVQAHRYGLADLAARWVRRHRATVTAIGLLLAGLGIAWIVRDGLEARELAARRATEEREALADVDALLAQARRGATRAERTPSSPD